MSDVPKTVNGIDPAELKDVISRIENLEAEKQGLNEDIKAVKQDAKARGFNVPIITKIIRMRKKEARSLHEEEVLTAAYFSALGMDDPRDGAEEQLID